MDVNKDLHKIKEGFAGEKVVRDYLKKVPNCRFTQIDIMANIDDKWYSIEVKHQDPFMPPPFKGHGLPIWQVKSRLKLYEDTGIIPLLFVLDKKSSLLYYQSILKLESGHKFKTKKSNRIIYPIENFKVIDV